MRKDLSICLAEARAERRASAGHRARRPVLFRGQAMGGGRWDTSSLLEAAGAIGGNRRAASVPRSFRPGFDFRRSPHGAKRNAGIEQRSVPGLAPSRIARLRRCIRATKYRLRRSAAEKPGGTRRVRGASRAPGLLSAFSAELDRKTVTPSGAPRGFSDPRLPLSGCPACLKTTSGPAYGGQRAADRS